MWYHRHQAVEPDHNVPVTPSTWRPASGSIRCGSSTPVAAPTHPIPTRRKRPCNYATAWRPRVPGPLVSESLSPCSAMPPISSLTGHAAVRKKGFSRSRSKREVIPKSGITAAKITAKTLRPCLVHKILVFFATVAFLFLFDKHGVTRHKRFIS